MVLLSLDNPRGGDTTSPLNNVVIEERGAEAEEADGRRDDIDFEGDRDAVVALLSLDLNKTKSTSLACGKRTRSKIKFPHDQFRAG